jgi:hypothetical protein
MEQCALKVSKGAETPPDTPTQQDGRANLFSTWCIHLSGIGPTEPGSADADCLSRPLHMRSTADCRHAARGLRDPDVSTRQDVPSLARSGLFSHYDAITRLFPFLPRLSLSRLLKRTFPSFLCPQATTHVTRLRLSIHVSSPHSLLLPTTRQTLQLDSSPLSLPNS